MFRLCLILLLLASSQAMARDFRYRNNRFGTSAMIPDSFYPKPGPINGDGRTFQGKRLAGSIRVYGSNNPAGQDLAAYRDYLQQLYLNEGRSITYQSSHSRWFAMSGWHRGQIYYIKVKGCASGPLHHVYFEYPGREKKDWSRIIGKVSGSLDGPCL